MKVITTIRNVIPLLFLISVSIAAIADTKSTPQASNQVTTFSVITADNSNDKKPRISEVQTEYVGENVKITINGINLLGNKNTVPYLAIGNGKPITVERVNPAPTNNTIVVTATKKDLPKGAYLIWLSRDEKFTAENSDFFDFTVGAVGPQGPEGATGPQGPAGEVGATGAQGPVGAMGPQGPIGPVGAVGPQGQVGTAGATGAQGPAGSQGQVGAAGATGAQGPAGPQGQVGATGAMGPQGPAGQCSGGAGSTPTVHTVGESYLGGVVIYVSDEGLHGVVAATEDSGYSTWYEASDVIPIGWRLPTKKELFLLLQQGQPTANDTVDSIGYHQYWSSTEGGDYSEAWVLYGNIPSLGVTNPKYRSNSVRAVRNF